MTIILAIIIFGAVVLVHEWGHFIVARKCGILVEEFAMGMGPILFKKQGVETLYTVRLFPVGGFCKMLGENSEEEDPRSFSSKSIIKRVLVIVAGAVMNFILAFVVIFFQVNFGVINTLEVSNVVEDYPAIEAGLSVGDEITHFNGKKIHLFQEFSMLVAENGINDINITVKRNGEDLNILVAPINIDNSFKIGVSPVVKGGVFLSTQDLNFEIDKANIFETFIYSVDITNFYIELILSSLADLVTGAFSINDMAGPIGFVQMLDTTSQEAIESIPVEGKTTMEILGEQISTALSVAASFIVMLSINLGVFNLLPLPALDGGRLFFIIIEALRGKPINPEKEGLVHIVGFILLMGLAVVVATVDIQRIFS